MSKATKNFIAGALVATLPLLVVSIMNDDNGGRSVHQSELKAQEQGLIYSASFMPPAAEVTAALFAANQEANNVTYDSSSKVAGKSAIASEVFTVDMVWNKKPIMGNYFYSNECTVTEYGFSSRIVARKPWDSTELVRHSSINDDLDANVGAAHCQALDKNGVFDELRGLMGDG